MRCAGLFALSVVFCIAGCQSRNASYPQPTEFAHTDQGKAEKKIYKQHRQEWMDQMHRSAPEVDWRQVDATTRRNKIIERMAERKRLKERGALSLKAGHVEVIETIAGTNKRGRWIERGSNNLSGRMVFGEVDLEQGLIYAGSAGGNVWRGNLDGTGWESLNDFMKVKGIETVQLVRSGQVRRLIVSQESPSTLYYTDDDGLTWDMAAGLDNAVRWGSIKRTIVTAGDPAVIYILLEEWDYGSAWRSIISIYKSEDLGAHFTRIHTFSNGQKKQCDMWTCRTESRRPFVLAGNVVYRITVQDDLAQMGTIDLNFNMGDVSKANLTGLVADSKPMLYALFAVSNQSRIYRSPDAGVTWTYQGTVDATPFFGVNSFACSTVNRDSVYLGGVDCYRSRNGGASWTKVNGWGEYYGDPVHKLHADIPAINVFQDSQGGEFVLISTDGGTYISRDDLGTVENLSLRDLRVSQYYDTYTHRVQPQFAYAGSQDQGCQRTTATQSTPGRLLDFDQLISGDYGHLVSGDRGDSFWAVYPSFAMYHPDARASDTNRRWNFSGMSGQLWMPPLMEDPENPQNVYLAGGGSAGGAHIYHLKHSNSKITAQELSYDFSGGNDRKISAMGYSPVESDLRYVATDKGEFFYSSDGGSHWTRSPAFDGPDGHYFYGSSIVASPVRAGEVFIAGSGYSNPAVYRSMTNGETFAAYDQGLPDTLVHEMAITPDGKILFAATEVGPYVRLVDQTEWIDLAGTTGPDQTYWSVEYIHALKSARFGTYGRGIWDFQFVDTQTADFEPDGDVDWQDFARLARAWSAAAGQAQWDPACDIDGAADGVIDTADLGVFAENWLREASLAGRWALEEPPGDTAVDASGSGRDGLLVNFASTDRVEGRFGGGLAFDGVDDLVRITGWKGIGGGWSRTCCAWFKTTDTGGQIVSWGVFGVPGGRWVFGTEAGGRLQLAVGAGAITGDTMICDGQWHHVAAVLDDDGTPNINEIKLYVDGVEEKIVEPGDRAINTDADPAGGAPDVRIGVWLALPQYFAGTLDEVRIYERALGADEVAALAGR